jgi:hypothetical protein
MELARLLKDMGQDVSFEKLALIMEKFDKDSSGQVRGMRGGQGGEGGAGLGWRDERGCQGGEG